MADGDDTKLERALGRVPGWLFLGVGLALVAAAVLTPPWLKARRAAWDHALMQAQVRALDRQAKRYAQFHQALVRRDPLLLERLAYVQLRLKPTDTRLLPPIRPRSGGDAALGVGASPRPAAPGQAGTAIPGGGEREQPARPAATEMLPIAAWLHEPLPTVGKEVAPYEPMDSRLTRLATGESRFALLGAGLLCAAGGLLTGRRRKA